MESHPNRNVSCEICFDVVKDAVDTDCCHHLYCHGCITQVTTGVCPSCRVTPLTFTPNMVIRRIVDNLPPGFTSNRRPEICLFYQLRGCNVPNCQYSHPAGAAGSLMKNTLCQYFSVGKPCPKGNRCPFKHERVPTRNQQRPGVAARSASVTREVKICTFFSSKGSCTKGNNCEFLHVVNSASCQQLASQSSNTATTPDPAKCLYVGILDETMLEPAAFIFKTLNGYDRHVFNKDKNGKTYAFVNFLTEAKAQSAMKKLTDEKPFGGGTKVMQKKTN